MENVKILIIYQLNVETFKHPQISFKDKSNIQQKISSLKKKRKDSPNFSCRKKVRNFVLLKYLFSYSFGLHSTHKNVLLTVGTRILSAFQRHALQFSPIIIIRTALKNSSVLFLHTLYDSKLTKKNVKCVLHFISLTKKLWLKIFFMFRKDVNICKNNSYNQGNSSLVALSTKIKP